MRPAKHSPKDESAQLALIQLINGHLADVAELNYVLFYFLEGKHATTHTTLNSNMTDSDIE